MAAREHEESLASDVSGTDDGKPVKRGRRSRPKVKTGCANCKQRRIKCDEARPSCTQCVRAKKVCTGYPPPPRSARPDYEVRIAPRPAPGLAPAPTSTPALHSSPSIFPALNESSHHGPFSREVTLPPRRARRAPSTATTSSSPAPGTSPSTYGSFSYLPPAGLDDFYFHIFSEQTAHQLSGFFDSSFYRERVLEACHTQPAIRHAAIGLGALSKAHQASCSYSRSPSASPREQEEHLSHWQVAVRQYSEACNAMMAIKDPSKDSLRTQLMASVLLASFDSFVGDHKQAIVQIQSGLDLLERIRSADRLPQFGVATDTVEEELTIIFMRLAIQAKSYDLAFHFNEPFVVKFTSPSHQARMQQLNHQSLSQPEIDPSLYNSRLSPGVGADTRASTPVGSPYRSPPFSNIGEARLAYDRMNERLIRVQESFKIRPKDAPRINMPEGWARNVAKFKEQLASWSQSFEPLLLSRHAPHVGRRERAGIAVLQMNYLTAIIVSSSQFRGSEIHFDEYTQVFQSIVDFGMEVIQEEEAVGAAACHVESAFCPHQRQLPPDFVSAGVFSPCHIQPIFSMDPGIVPPLFIAATKCRVPNLRRQAIELLRGCARREGMWDGELISRMAHWIMKLEESPTGAHSPFSVQGGRGSPYDDMSLDEPTDYFPELGRHLSNRPYMTVPEDRRVCLRSVDFDLRARWANVVVGTRNAPEGMPDPRYRSTQITW